jgi:hypothetical protein
MRHFAVLDQDGNILRSGSCPQDLIELQGERVIETDQPYDDTLYRFDGEKMVLREAPVSRLEADTSPQYVTERRAAYPSIEDQLDTLYHEGFESWRATIAAVKAQHPK